MTTKKLQLLLLVAFKPLTARTIANEYRKKFGRIVSYGYIYSCFLEFVEKKLAFCRVETDCESGKRLTYFQATDIGLNVVNSCLESERDVEAAVRHMSSAC